jgi:hypothetical protein
VSLRAGLDRCGKSRLNRDSIPDRSAHSSSLYRLSYPGPPNIIGSIHEDVPKFMATLVSKGTTVGERVVFDSNR